MELDIENRLSRELQGKRLICEAAFTQDQIDNWFDIILPKGINAWNSLPALSAVITTATGIYKYEGGDLWSAFPTFASVGERVKWGKQFKRFIEKHETLESFQNLEGHKYVAPILAHGGIPQYCLSDFFTLLIRYGDPEQQGSEFINYIGSHKTSLVNIDEPVKRFLLYGGEVAEEFVARCLSLWASRESGKDEGTHGLPERVVDAFSEWYKEHSPSHRIRRQRFPKPQIRISPWDLWVYLHLPRCDNHPEIDQGDCWETVSREWAVTRDHNVFLPVCDKWTVRCNGHNVVLKGVNDDDPVMFFDPDTGKVIANPEVRRLPEYLWAVMGKSHNIYPEPVSTEEIPYWPGYVFIALDLREHQCVIIDEKQYEVRRPFFNVGQEPVVKGVSTVNSLPVYHQPPKIDWEGEANFSFIQNGIDEGNIDITSADFQIWFDKPGCYEFHLRGPLGQNIHNDFFMVPNLNMALRPEIRWPNIFTVKCDITSDQVDMRNLEGQSPPFISHKSCVQFKALWNEIETELMITVPRLKWRILTTVGEVPDWGDKPLKLSLRDLENAEYPRLICTVEPLTTEANLCLVSKHGFINTVKPQQNSAHIEQNIWSFDLRTVRDEIRQSGTAEKFEILVRATDETELYRGVILTVTPEWGLQNFRAEWKKEDINMIWQESGPVISGRYLIMLPLWRPWEDAVQIHQLNEEERHSKHWHLPDIRPGRYIVRTVHAPWEYDNWRTAQYLNQEILDINMGLLSSIFEYESGAKKTIEIYFEHLLAHWYRPEEVTRAPTTPLNLTPEQINDFLKFLEQADLLTRLKIPRDNSGSLSIFCMNPQATTKAVENRQDFSDIWIQVLPSRDVISLNPGMHDRAFIYVIINLTRQ